MIRANLKIEPEITISVIIVNWNGRHYLDECFKALTGQRFQDFEIILVDNGSNDGSVFWVKKNFPWVRVVALNRNNGFCRANNLGYAASKGKFIALLNNDTKVDSEWLFCLYRQMTKDDRIGICASRIIQYDNPEILDTAGDGYDLSGVGFRRGRGEEVKYYKKSEEVFGACAAAVLYRKTMIEKIGLFDEVFFAVGEDVDVSFRAKMAGYKCVYVPNAIVYHKVSGTIGFESRSQVYWSRRNLEKVYFKNMPLTLLLLTFPLHLAYNLLTLVQALRQKKLSIFFRAKLDFLLDLKDVLKKRRKIQKNRRILLKDLLSSFSKKYLIKRSLLEFKGSGHSR